MSATELFISQHADTLNKAIFIWLAFWVLASAIYRIRRRKPLFAEEPLGAQFFETWASGYTDSRIMKMTGGARNCLHVSVTPSEVQIGPHFPFTLMFLPELTGLELRIARADILSLERRERLFGDVLVISFREPGKETRSLVLKLSRGQEFLNVMNLEAVS